MLALAGVVVMAVLGAGAVCWALVFLRVVANGTWAPEPFSNVARSALDQAQVPAGSPLIPWSDRRPVPWALIDLIVIILMYFVLGLVIGVTLRESGWLPQGVKREKLTLDQRQLLVGAQVAISLLLITIALPLVILRSGAKLRDLGWNSSKLGQDVKLGVIAFVMLAPPVYAIQALVVQFWPSKHPIMEMFRGTPEPQFFAVLVLAAVIVAPVFEELVFRVLLQGFLENVFSFQLSTQSLTLGSAGRAQFTVGSSETSALPHDHLGTFVPPLFGANPNGPSSAVGILASDSLPTTGTEDQQRQDAMRPLRGVCAVLPIVITALVFALLHEWPDQIPLVFLAIGLGYLYQRTHRIVPSLIVHALLNGLSMWGLWIQVFEMPK